MNFIAFGVSWLLSVLHFILLIDLPEYIALFIWDVMFAYLPLKKVMICTDLDKMKKISVNTKSEAKIFCRKKKWKKGKFVF